MGSNSLRDNKNILLKRCPCNHVLISLQLAKIYFLGKFKNHFGRHFQSEILTGKTAVLETVSMLHHESDVIV